MQREKGITLVALVVTIVVLLILAGISISSLTGENGILNQATRAKEQTEIASYREALQLIGINLEAERVSDDEFMDRYKQDIEADKMFEDAKSVEKLSSTALRVITKEGYTFYVKRDDVTYLGKGDDAEEPPPDVPDIVESDIKFTMEPSEPTQGSVKVTISTEIADCEIVYSLTGEDESWQAYTEPITFTDNGVVFAKLQNDAGVSETTATLNIENIDRLAPKQFVPTATSTSNTITLTGSTEDAVTRRRTNRNKLYIY